MNQKLTGKPSSRPGRERFRDRAASAGVALVITLIMVSVIAFMAITFLILSSRERGSVASTNAQTDARLAAESGVQRAVAQVMAGIIASTNPDNYTLIVSTNFINPRGFNPNPGIDDDNRTNVNYDYYVGTGNRISTNAGTFDQPSNLTNLLYDPRPPVFITNTAAGGMDFRFYLDLNRNGLYETNGDVPYVIHNNAGNSEQYLSTNGSFLPPSFANAPSSVHGLHVGDPEWIGVLERPEAPHSSSNRFLSRYCYIVVPSGKTLDINYIHNYAGGIAKGRSTTMASGTDDGYLRNQGVGSWELNLAAFLSDLNTNSYAWPANKLGDNLTYNYTPDGFGNYQGYGIPFNDALEILRYRYGTNNIHLLINPGLSNILANYPLGGPPNGGFFQTNGFDDYSDGPFWTNLTGIDESIAANFDRTNRAWAGSDNANRYFSHQDLFNPAKGVGSFLQHLQATSIHTNDYDRYTFYRLLEQLGSDSAADKRMNLRYDNLTQTNGSRNVTNLLVWEPIVFFTNAANRLLAAYSNQVFFNNGVTNYPNSVSRIQLYPTNVYTPSVHRLLQVAANLYDATTNRNPLAAFPPANVNVAAPSVFRPIFTNFTVGSNDFVYIIGYSELTNASQITNVFYCDLEVSTNRQSLATGGTTNMVYGIPCVVGAKKFMPNFNEYAFQTVVRVTRKFVFSRANPRDVDSKVAYTNQMLIFAVSNAFGAEFWNSYKLKYPRDVDINLTNELFCELTNVNNGHFAAPGLFVGDFTTNRLVQGVVTGILAASSSPWSAYDADYPSYSFKVPFATNYTFLSNLIYLDSTTPPRFVPNVPARADTNHFYAFTTNWVLKIKNRCRAVVTDRASGRILDYVNFSGMDHSIDLSRQLIGNTTLLGQPSMDGQFWQTNRLNDSTDPKVMHIGGMNQILTSLDTVGHQVDSSIWKNYSTLASDNGTEIDSAIVKFQNEMGFQTTRPLYGAVLTKHATFDAPFQPTRAVYVRESWTANDPLVHYMLEDLTDITKTNEYVLLKPPYTSLPALTTDYLGLINQRYQPWNRDNGDSGTITDLSVKDPWVREPMDWNFPTNGFANLGWIGRVHRGTPWQTIYLKSTVADTNIWKKWTGNTRDIDSTVTWPTNDYLISSVFTAVPNDNAGRGRLNVNQTNLAAWSAVLSGVLTLSNNLSDSVQEGQPLDAPRSYEPVLIEPAGVPGINSQLGQIVASINNAQTNGYFTSPADVFAAPRLTVDSPFLNTSAVQRASGITEEMYERIPQQILGLLTAGSPRFVIYAYGQSLKPADNSIIQRSDRPGFTGLCTNYQITGEVAVRAVVGTVYTNGTWQALVESYNTLAPDY